jgi:hypothetical protein
MTEVERNTSIADKSTIEDTPVKSRGSRNKANLFEKDSRAFISDLIRFHENRG